MDTAIGLAVYSQETQIPVTDNMRSNIHELCSCCQVGEPHEGGTVALKIHFNDCPHGEACQSGTTPTRHCTSTSARTPTPSTKRPAAASRADAMNAASPICWMAR